jgi:hypothetical protein
LKYKAIFLRKIGEYEKNKVVVVDGTIGKNKQIALVKTDTKRPNFVRVGEKEFKATDETLTFKNNSSFVVQLEAYSEQNKDTLIYYYDFDSGDLISLETLLKFNIKPHDLNKITGKKIVEQIVAGAKSVQGNPLIYIILPIAVGIGMLLLGYWMGGGFNKPTVITQPPIVTNP